MVITVGIKIYSPCNTHASCIIHNFQHRYIVQQNAGVNKVKINMNIKILKIVF